MGINQQSLNIPKRICSRILETDSRDLETEIGNLETEKREYMRHDTLETGLHRIPRSLVAPTRGADCASRTRHVSFVGGLGVAALETGLKINGFSEV